MLRRSRHDALLIRVVSAAFGLASIHGACGRAPQRLPVDAEQNTPSSAGDGGAADLPPGTDRGANMQTDGLPAQDTPSSADGSPPPDTAPISDGVVEGTPSADAMLPSAGGGAWQRLPALPSVRQEHGVAVVNGQIFVVGGLAPAAARVDAYDPQTNVWTPHTNLPVGVDHPNVAGVGDKLYLLGGTQTSDVFEYNPLAAPPDRRWTMKSALPVARAAGAAGVIGNKVLLAGGRGGGVTAGVDLQIYDTAADTWQASSRGELPPLPVGRNHLAGVVADGLFFVIGGRSVSTTSTLYNRVDVYDPVARSWSERAPMPTRRGGVSAGVAAGLIIAVGGEGNDRGLNANGVFPQTEAFSPRANTWVSLAPMMTPRHGLGVAGIGDKLYVPGGGTVQDLGGASDAFDVLSPY
ncbi:MAG TPA: kelch repeat-containing protein [Polyangia bacterium]|jgi:N-acetylneuraminic acid mutarotase|nr:kelch repeat-containing protein [Polyangia bacterium]